MEISMLINGKEFKRIDGFANYYISSEGEIFSYKTQSFVKTVKNKQGIWMVKLRQIETAKGKNLYIHRLVAETWVPNPHEYPIIHHKDKNNDNNSAENLEWVSLDDHKATVNYWGKSKTAVMYKDEVYESVADCAMAYGVTVRTAYTWLHKGLMTKVV